ncbi:MAG: MMPL family transporter [Pirellulaceae bacterium]|jgi:hypothetical protein|nr:MMPL family transporter [Pirellulaceae bacterium]MDP7019622.1 MMPL family transporter [Pirellulaceae bacterium]
MEKLFNRLPSLRWPLALLLVASAPFAAFGGWRAWSNVLHQRLVEELPDDSAAAALKEAFGESERLVIRWDDCRLNDPRIDAYKRALLAASDDRSAFFQEVISGGDVKAILTDGRMELGDDEIRRRMAGWILAPDGEQTVLIALLAPAGVSDRRGAVEFVYAAADSVDGLAADDLQIAGRVVEQVAVDDARKSFLMFLHLLSIGISFLVAIACLRSLRAAAVVSFVAIYSELLSLASFDFAGLIFGPPIYAAATFSFMWSIAIGVHWVQVYRQELRDAEQLDAAVRAVRVVQLPTAISAIAIVAGIYWRDFGELQLYASFCCAATLIGAIATMVFVPAYFSIWPLRVRRPNVRRGYAAKSSPYDGWVNRVQRFRWIVIPVTALGLVAGGEQIRRRRTSGDLGDQLRESSAVRADTAKIENTTGPSAHVAILVSFPAAGGRDQLSQFRSIQRLHDRIEGLDDAFVAWSAANVAPPAPEPGGGVRQIARAAAFRRRLDENQRALGGFRNVRRADDAAHWRITLHLPARYGDIDLAARLRAEAGRSLESGSAGDEWRVYISNSSSPLSGESEVESAQLNSYFFAAPLVASLFFLLGFRSLPCGLLAPIPLALPCVLVFGWCQWRGSTTAAEVDLAAFVVFAVNAFFTAQMIGSFRRRMTASDQRDIRAAAAAACGEAGTAALLTALICGVGILSLMFSPFAAVRQFATCSIALFAAALGNILIALPAVLLSGFGKRIG